MIGLKAGRLAHFFYSRYSHNRIAIGGTHGVSVRSHHLSILCGGCNLVLEVLYGQIVGTLPAKTGPSNEGRLCIKGWNVHEFIQDKDRLTSLSSAGAGSGRSQLE